MPLSRALLQRLSDARLTEAKLLAAAGHHAGAFYLAGYAVELALKACIAKQFKAEEIPDWPFFKDTRTHKLDQLVRLAGLGAELNAKLDSDAQFDAYWQVVENWRTDSRYELTSGALASQLIEALSDPQHGAMQWIKTHW